MSGADFLMAELARIAYIEGFSEGISGMEAICFTLRNRVNAGWYGGEWSQILGNYRKTHYRLDPPSDIVPDPRVYSFQCLLQEINGIFNGSRADDVTVTKDSVLKTAPIVLYWAKLNEISNPAFLEITRNPAHQRAAQVGALTFLT